MHRSITYATRRNPKVVIVFNGKKKQMLYIIHFTMFTEQFNNLGGMVFEGEFHFAITFRNCFSNNI